MESYRLFRTSYLYPFGEMLVILTAGDLDGGGVFHEYFILALQENSECWALRTRLDRAAAENGVLPRDEDEVLRQALKQATDKIYLQLVEHWSQEGNLRMVPDSIPTAKAGLGDLVGLRLRNECEAELRYVRDSTRLAKLSSLLDGIFGISVAKTEKPET